jgi:hypothetical protein
VNNTIEINSDKKTPVLFRARVYCCYFLLYFYTQYRPRFGLETKTTMRSDESVLIKIILKRYCVKIIPTVLRGFCESVNVI